MPPLPKLLNKREAHYTPRVIKYFLKHHPETTMAVEVKYTKGTTLPVSKIAPHQLQALRSVRQGAFHFKIPDMGVRNPFDFFILHAMPAYIAIVFEGGKKLGIISPDAVPIKGSIREEDCFILTTKF